MPILLEKKFICVEERNYLDLSKCEDKTIVFLNIYDEYYSNSMSVGLLKTDIEELILDLIKLKNEMQ